jgi:hypothetical protein
MLVLGDGQQVRLSTGKRGNLETGIAQLSSIDLAVEMEDLLLIDTPSVDVGEGRE